MAENKPVVESIKIGTLDKQIEILEQLGLTNGEITNLIYDTQGQITAENTDTLDIIIQQFSKILEQDELKTIEELAITLLANQSEASVKYVLGHELVGKVLKYVLKSNNDDFVGKTIRQIMSTKELFDEIYTSKSIFEILKNSVYWGGIALTDSIDIILNKREYVGKIIETDSLIRDVATTNSYVVEQILMRYGHVFHTHGVKPGNGPSPWIKSTKRCIAPLTWFNSERKEGTFIKQTHRINITVGEGPYSIEKFGGTSTWTLTRFHREDPHVFTDGYINEIRMVPASFSVSGGYGVFLKNESDLADVENKDYTEVMTYAEFRANYPEIA